METRITQGVSYTTCAPADPHEFLPNGACAWCDVRRDSLGTFVPGIMGNVA